jgi:multidrug efflux pump subunit AcrA (membrane-fusion protein)
VARRARGWTAALALALFPGLPLLVGCSAEQAPAPPVPSVRVVRVTPRPAVALEEYVARISASNTVEIRPQVDGRLEKQTAVEGQRVEAGALLYQIDPAPFRAALSRAEAGSPRRAASSNA